MAGIYSYITFNGNCLEAMTYYQKCFGGRLVVQTIGGSPLGKNLPRHLKKYVLSASLTKKDMILMGSDIVPENGLIKGNSVSLSLFCDSEKEIERLYKKLAVDGQANQPLQITFWNAIFGNVTDKFGVHWLLNFDKHKKQHKT